MSPSATGQQDGELASSSLSPRRALRIAGTSGSAADRRYALARLAKDDKLDVIIGDWLSEVRLSGHFQKQDSVQALDLNVSLTMVHC